MLTSFKYMGWVISAVDDDYPEVVRNLAKARAVLRRLTQIISRGGAAPRVSGFSFKDMVQLVIIFGVTSRIGRLLGGGSRTRWCDS